MDNRFVNDSYTCKTVLHTCYCSTFTQGSDRFLSHCTVLSKPVPDCRRSCSISRPHSFTSLHTVAHRNVSSTRLYRYYRGKTNFYRGENFYRYIANDKISPIHTELYMITSKGLTIRTHDVFLCLSSLNIKPILNHSSMV